MDEGVVLKNNSWDLLKVKGSETAVNIPVKSGLYMSAKQILLRLTLLNHK